MLIIFSDIFLMTILKWLIAEQLFLNEQLFIANEILAEVVYVLLGVYKISKIDIADKLTQSFIFANLIGCF